MEREELVAVAGIAIIVVMLAVMVSFFIQELLVCFPCKDHFGNLPAPAAPLDYPLINWID